MVKKETEDQIGMRRQLTWELRRTDMATVPTVVCTTCAGDRTCKCSHSALFLH